VVSNSDVSKTLEDLARRGGMGLILPFAVRNIPEYLSGWPRT
jgi:hypothetical protein